MDDPCVICGKPRRVSRADFYAWFMQKPPQPFVPLRTFLADYCTCERMDADADLVE